MEEGGHAAGLIRIYMAVANANKDINGCILSSLIKSPKTHKILSKYSVDIQKNHA